MGRSAGITAVPCFSLCHGASSSTCPSHREKGQRRYIASRIPPPPGRPYPSLRHRPAEPIGSSRPIPSRALSSITLDSATYVDVTFPFDCRSTCI